MHRPVIPSCQQSIAQLFAGEGRVMGDAKATKGGLDIQTVAESKDMRG